MKFTYRAFEKSGKSRSETIEASSSAEASELLRRQGLFVADLKPATEVAAAGLERGRGAGSGGGRGGLGGRAKHLASFMRQLSVLVKTGTPLVDAMQALEKQTVDQGWLKIISNVRSRVEEGQTLSEALAAHPRAFDSVCRSLIRAGESGGNLGDMLTRLSELTRKQVKIRQQLIGAMVYPSVLIVVAVAVTLTMMLFVMPRFSGLFKSLDVPLPPTTRLLMGTSEFLITYWWGVLAGAGLVVGGVWAWLRTPGGTYALHSVLLKAPQVGRLVRGLGTARFARLMGVLLESRVPMLECLELTRQACPNVHYASLLTRTHEALQRGEPLSSAISEGGIIEASVCEAVKSGERTGQIGPVLTNMADFIEEQNEVVIKSLTSLVEPLILISLGVVVGLMATSMFLPLFDLTASAGGTGGTGGAGGAVKFMLNKRSLIGLDVGPRSIAAVQLAGGPSKGSRRVEAAALVSRRAAGKGQGWAPKADELADVAEMLYRQGFSGNRLVIAAPEASLVSTTLELPPRSSGAPIAELVRQELSRSAKRDAATIEVSSWDVPAPPRSGDSTHVLAVGLGHKEAAEILDSYEEAGLSVEVMECRCCAMVRASADLLGGAGHIAAVLDLTESSASIAVVHSGVVVYNRPVIEAGLGRLREEIRKELRSDDEAVDYVVDAMLNPAATAAGEAPEGARQTSARVVDEYLATVLHELRSVMAYAIHRYGASGGAETVGPVLLTGPGAMMPGLTERIHKELDLESRRVCLSDVAATPTELKQICRDPALTTAAGLAMRPLAAARRAA